MSTVHILRIALFIKKSINFLILNRAVIENAMVEKGLVGKLHCLQTVHLLR
jgi:hypothetical protein